MSRVKPGYFTDFKAFFTCSSEIDIPELTRAALEVNHALVRNKARVNRTLLKMPVRLAPMAEETPKAPTQAARPQFSCPTLRTTRSTEWQSSFIGPGNPFCSEFDIRFRQKGEKAARLLSLQSPGFASRTRRGISPSLDSPAA